MRFRTGLALALALTVTSALAGSPVAAQPTAQALGCRVVVPASEATLQGMVVLSADATDAVAAHYLLDGHFIGNAHSTGYGWLISPDGGKTWGWDSTTFANGRFPLTCVARAADGRTAVSAPVWVTVANPSGCQIVLPTGREPLSGEQVFSAASHVANTAKVEYYLNGSLLGAATPSIYGWILRWNAVRSPGAYRLNCVATGPTGVRHSSPTVLVTIDNVTRHDWASYCSDHVATTPADYEAAFSYRRGGWAGADGAHPIRLPDGRTMWMFGDTYAGQVDANNALLPGWRMPSNSVVIQSGTCFTPVMGGTPAAPREFLTNAAGHRFWPANGYVDETVSPPVLRITATQVNGECGWFRLVGVRVFTLSLPALQVISDAPAPYNQAATNVPSFGTWLMRDGGFVYLYGDASGFQCTRTDPGPYPAGRYVARTTPSRLATGPWEFWNGTGWSAAITAAAPMVWQGSSTAPWAQATMRYGNQFLTTSRPGAFGPTVNAWFSAGPAGPWTQLLRNGSPADIVPAGSGFPQPRWYYGGIVINPGLMVFSTNGIGCSPPETPCTPDNDNGKNVMLYGPHFVRPLLP
jgi:hypothetical protein